MPNTIPTISAGRWSRRLITAAVFLGVAVSSSPRDADAATARVRWLASSSGSATGYRVYARNAGGLYGTALWTGNPTPDASGTLSAQVTYTPAASGVNYFTVVAVNDTLESGLSRELPIGQPNPCTFDSCSTKTSCVFGNRPDGTSCDDQFFCNGAEVCLTGVCRSGSRDCADAVECTVDGCDEATRSCTHVGPPGCCATCDSDDPCLAEACAVGECQADPGIDIEVNRVKMLRKASGIMLIARGRFEAAAQVDPTVTGVDIELLAPDGTILYQSTLSPGTIQSRSPGRYRYSATWDGADGFENGLTSLDLRVKDGQWKVTLKGSTPILQDAFGEANLTWLLRMGDTCARRLYMFCDPTTQKSICR